MKSFAAKYAGRCTASECVYGDGRIEPGDDITYQDDDVVHVECASTRRQCKSCNTFHNGRCDE